MEKSQNGHSLLADAVVSGRAAKVGCSSVTFPKVAALNVLLEVIPYCSELFGAESSAHA